MIEIVTDTTLESVLPLIRQYQTFYKIADISDDRNRRFFARFGEGSAEGCQFIYRNEQGAVCGFATLYFSFVSSIPAKVGVLNDLFTLPTERGKGVGKALLQYAHDYALAHGAARLQWLTAPDNKQAQLLYDSLPANKSTWLVYTYKN